MSTKTRLGILAILALGLAGQGGAHPGHEPEQAAPAPQAPPASEDPIPDLDDLLGLPKTKPATPETPKAADPARTELERELAGQRIDDQFKEAIVLMGDTASRLETGRDAGVQTQRLQEEVIKRLDMLIAAAKQQQQQQQQSSSQQQQQQQQQQQAQQRQEAGAVAQSSADEPDEQGRRPGGKTEPLREMLDAASAAWGALPPRVREALLQGGDEQFSSMYEAMTEQYYRRLAEQRPEE